jgi:hypothetical protein
VLRHLGPSVVVALLLSPIILRGVGGADAARAQQILFEIRSPHHYRPRGYLNDFFPFLAWQALGLGLGGWVLRAGEGRGRRFGALVLGLLAVVWLGTFGAVVLDSRRVTQVFVWRFAPYIDLLMELMVAASATRLLFTPRAAMRLSRPSLGLALAGGIGLAVSLTLRDPATVGWLEEIALVAVAGVALRAVLPFSARVVSRIPPAVPRAAPWVAAAVAAFAFFASVRDPLASVRARSNLITGMPGAETDLYAWLRANTPKDATILSPPGLERFRLASERPIVVDWKTSTYAPSELVEWYRRLEDVSGHPGLRGRDEVVAGYVAMDRTRLEALRQQYHLSYAVVARGREGALGHRTVYSNGQFAVLDLTN